MVEMVIVRDNVAYVKRSKGTPVALPRWMGAGRQDKDDVSTENNATGVFVDD